MIDRTATDGAVLDRTESDGVLGRSLLCSPLSTHLRETERARYVAWNKKRGVTCIHGGPDTYTPSGSYRAFAVATDTRLLFVVGGDGSDGDRVFSLPYSDVLTVETTANFLASTLELVAEENSAGSSPAVATSTRSRGTSTRPSSAGPGPRRCSTGPTTGCARPATPSRTGDWTPLWRPSTLPRHTSPTHGTTSANWGRVRWHAGPLPPTTSSTTRPTPAVDSPRPGAPEPTRAPARPGTTASTPLHTTRTNGPARPTSGRVPWACPISRQERLATVDGECEQLARAPIERAREAADAARAADDEQATIEHWETALERYRTALALDWGRDRRFDGDPEQLRTAVTDTATAVVDARRRVAQDRLDLSDWLAKSGDEEGARAALREARDHFERAHEVAAELVPDRRDRTTEDMASVAERVARLDADRGASDTEV
ncbi:hypothetical protein ACFQL1_13030 [Halomicroarcula sp. GCM10025709]|uniref:hypothetical protein n=1 Tax=Halomicroarcula sp. GCM10025709 TaxID=3252669 RepID=UPI0036222527